MKTLFVVGGRLAIICTTAALILALVNALTEPVIVENKRRALEEGLLAISAQAPQGGLRLADPLPEDMVPAEYEGLIGVYPLTSSDGNVEGYVVRLVGVGYGGELNLLAGYQTDGTLFAARLMENQETPGLGKKAENEAYMAKFMGTGGSEAVPTSRTDLEGPDADAVTGATITFLGVANALAEGADFVASLGRR